jgi:small subunit ribosomal protein S4
MSRYLGSSCKQCRRSKEKLFLKGDRCFTKCALDRKRGKNPPGEHGLSHTKMSDYSRHLKEKQKARRIYGLTEEQFRHYFDRADKMRGLTGDTLLKLLELRLDNVVYRMGFVTSRKLARQIVNHKNVLVNEKCINIPGYQLKPGDKITLKKKLKENINVKKSLERNINLPSWLKIDVANLVGSVLNPPSQGEFSHPIESQLIVELYSK